MANAVVVDSSRLLVAQILLLRRRFKKDRNILIADLIV